MRTEKMKERKNENIGTAQQPENGEGKREKGKRRREKESGKFLHQKIGVKKKTILLSDHYTVGVKVL